MSVEGAGARTRPSDDEFAHPDFPHDEPVGLEQAGEPAAQGPVAVSR
jgi:hypothetical protein